MFEVIINLIDFESLEKDVNVLTFFDEVNGQNVEEIKEIKGYVRVNIEEFSEVLGEELKYQIQEFKNLVPNWIYNYEFEEKGFGLEIIGIKKIEDDYVYFEIV